MYVYGAINIFHLLLCCGDVQRCIRFSECGFVFVLKNSRFTLNVYTYT